MIWALLAMLALLASVASKVYAARVLAHRRARFALPILLLLVVYSLAFWVEHPPAFQAFAAGKSYSATAAWRQLVFAAVDVLVVASLARQGRRRKV